jgi:hypothetical protein
MNLKTFLALTEVTQVGYQDITAKKLFGPVYHGTTAENLDKILQSGFKFQVGLSKTGDTRHGFELKNYGNIEVPPPVHFLGYGVYFTQNKTIAKDFNQGSGKGIKEFYLDAPRMETINFGAVNTMMKWWKSHGYDMQPISSFNQQSDIEQAWIKATVNLTNNLKSQFDAILFKGKGFRNRLLDGNQVCVYDPSRIYLFNSDLNASDSYFVGDRVKVVGLPVAIKITGSRPAVDRPGPWSVSVWDAILNKKSTKMFSVTISQRDLGIIYQKYRPTILNLLTTDNRFRERMDIRAKNSGLSLEDSASALADHEIGSLPMNFPESLLEKKLEKGKKIQ